MYFIWLVLCFVASYAVMTVGAALNTAGFVRETANEYGLTLGSNEPSVIRAIRGNMVAPNFRVLLQCRRWDRDLPLWAYVAVCVFVAAVGYPGSIIASVFSGLFLGAMLKLVHVAYVVNNLSILLQTALEEPTC